MTKPNNIIVMKAKDVKEFFLQWVWWLYPVHKLKEREIEVAAMYLYKRYELLKIIPVVDPSKSEKEQQDAEILRNKTLFSTETKQEIADELGTTLGCIKVHTTALKKAGVVISETREKGAIPDRLNPRFIPALDYSDNTFRLQFYWKISDEQGNQED